MFIAFAVGCSSGSESGKDAENNFAGSNATSANNVSSANSTSPNTFVPPDLTPCMEPIRLEVEGQLVPTKPKSVALGAAGRLWGVFEAAQERRLYRSDDNGASWQLETKPESEFSSAFNPDWVVATDQFVLVASRFQNYVLSSDGGASWTEYFGDWGASAYQSLPDGRLVRAQPFRTIEVSDDGESWAEMVRPNPEEDIEFVAINGSNIAVTSGGDVDYSLDAGETWTTIVPPVQSLGFSVVDDAEGPLFLFVDNSDRGIVYESRDAENWVSGRQLGRNLGAVKFFAFDGNAFAGLGSTEPPRVRVTEDDWTPAPATMIGWTGVLDTTPATIVAGRETVDLVWADGTVEHSSQVSTTPDVETRSAELIGLDWLTTWRIETPTSFSARLMRTNPDCETTEVLHVDYATFGLETLRFAAILTVYNADQTDFFFVAEDDLKPTSIPLRNVEHAFQTVTLSYAATGETFAGEKGLVRSIDGTTWFEPEPLLKSAATVAEDGSSPALQYDRIAKLDGSPFHYAIEDRARIYVSEDFGEWELFDVDGLPPADSRRIGSTVATNGQLYMIVQDTPGSEPRRLWIGNEAEFRWVDLPAQGAGHELFFAQGEIFVHIYDAPAFGGEEAFSTLWRMNPDFTWQTVIPSDVGYLSVSGGVLVAERDDAFVPLAFD